MDSTTRLAQRQRDGSASVADRLRLGQLDPQRVALAAALGHKGALASGVAPANVGRDPWDWPVDTLDDSTWRLWACDCAERALRRERAAGREPDQRSWEAVRVARAYARGEATGKELRAARDAAWSAAWSAARDAAWSAACSAAWSADWSADWSATRSAASAADWSAERDWQRDALARRLCGEEVTLWTE